MIWARSVFLVSQKDMDPILNMALLSIVVTVAHVAFWNTHRHQSYATFGVICILHSYVEPSGNLHIHVMYHRAS